MFLLEELLWHMARLDKDTAGDMEVCTVVVAETRSRLRKDTDSLSMVSRLSSF